MIKPGTIEAMRLAELGEAVDEGVRVNGARWEASVKFRGRQRAEMFRFEEFHNLGEIIESGPDWDGIDKITIKLARKP